MKVQIVRRIEPGEFGGDYAHYSGQVAVDHPHEAEWLKAGAAIPVVEKTETAVAPVIEKRKGK